MTRLGKNRVFCEIQIIPENILLYSRKFSRTLNFAVFEDFTTALKINSSKSYYSIESFDSLVDPQNLICEIYHEEITSKVSALKITRYMVCFYSATVSHVPGYHTELW